MDREEELRAEHKRKFDVIADRIIIILAEAGLSLFEAEMMLKHHAPSRLSEFKISVLNPAPESAE
jgi:hypothetical protein